MTQLNGVKVDMISKTRLDNTPTMEKIQLILDSVRDGKVVIIEGGLSREEEGQLVEHTMSKITPDGFTGIEIERPPQSQSSSGLRNRLGKLVSGDSEGSEMMLVGPADKLETVKKDDQLVSTFIKDRGPN